MDFTQLKKNLLELPIVIWGIMLIATLIHVFLCAERWLAVLDALNMDRTSPQHMHKIGFDRQDANKYTLIGCFFNQCLPSGIGGDVYKAIAAKSKGFKTSDAVNSTVIDRVYGLLSFSFYSIIFIPFYWGDLTKSHLGMAIIALSFMPPIAFVGLLLLNKADTEYWWKIPVMGRLVAKAISIFQVFSLAILKTAKNNFKKIIICSMLANFMCYFAITIASHYLGSGIGMDQLMLVFTFVMIVTILPISFAGWGLRETTFVMATGLLGADPNHALTLSVLYGLTHLIASLPGLVIWIANKQ